MARVIPQLEPDSSETVCSPLVAQRFIDAANELLGLRPGAGIAIVKANGGTRISTAGASRCPLYVIPRIGKDEPVGLWSADRANQVIGAANYFRGLQGGSGVRITKADGRLLFEADPIGGTVGELAPLALLIEGDTRTMLSCEVANEVVDALNAALASEALPPLRLIKAESGWVLESGAPVFTDDDGDGEPDTGDGTRHVYVLPQENWDGMGIDLDTGKPAPTPWITRGGYVDLYGFGPGGEQGPFDWPLHLQHPEDRREFVDLVGTPFNAGADFITRKLFRLEAGHTYELVFEIAGNGRAVFPLEMIRVGVGEDALNENVFAESIALNSGSDWHFETRRFVCPTLTTRSRIKFRQLFPNSPINYFGTFLDNVSLTDIDTGDVVFSDAFTGLYTI
jgi:hypothetical protein